MMHKLIELGDILLQFVTRTMIIYLFYKEVTREKD